MSPINRNDFYDKRSLSQRRTQRSKAWHGELLCGALGILKEEKRLPLSRLGNSGLPPAVLYPLAGSCDGPQVNMMKTRFLLLGFAIASITSFVYRPFAGAQTPQSDATQAPAGPPGATQGGPEASRRGGQGRAPGVFGKISALQADSIEVTAPDGTKASIKLTSSTEFRKDRQPAKMSDFKVGDTVVVQTNQDSGSAAGATALMVAAVRPGGFLGRGGGGGGGQGMTQGTMGKDYVVGEVKSVDPPKLVVLRADNVTQTLELNEDTSLRRGRDSITMADIQPGDHIFARGAVANGAFVAKNVMVISPEQWKRMQEMMSEGGERRPAPQNSPGPPPASAPSTAPTPPEQPN